MPKPTFSLCTSSSREEHSEKNGTAYPSLYVENVEGGVREPTLPLRGPTCESSEDAAVVTEFEHSEFYHERL